MHTKKAFKSKELKPHVVHMTQFYVHDFNDPSSPSHISTYDITSCVVVLIKNIDEHKKCSSFGMAHVNFANIFFKDKGKENLNEFISSFEAIGGQLKNASIQVLGGLIVDSNQVRAKTIDILKEIFTEKGLGQVAIKAPVSQRVDASMEGREKGNSQVMTISCDQNGTYTRKVTFTKGKRTNCEFYPKDCSLLSDKNLKNIVPVDPDEYHRVKSKTHNFQVEANKLIESGLDPLSKEFSYKEQAIKKNFCTIEQSTSTFNIQSSLGLGM